MQQHMFLHTLAASVASAVCAYWVDNRSSSCLFVHDSRCAAKPAAFYMGEPSLQSSALMVSHDEDCCDAYPYGMLPAWQQTLASTQLSWSSKLLRDEDMLLAVSYDQDGKCESPSIFLLVKLADKSDHDCCGAHLSKDSLAMLHSHTYTLIFAPARLLVSNDSCD